MSNDRPVILVTRLAARARGEISEVDDLPNQFPVDFIPHSFKLIVPPPGSRAIADDIHDFTPLSEKRRRFSFKIFVSRITSLLLSHAPVFSANQAVINPRIPPDVVVSYCRSSLAAAHFSSRSRPNYIADCRNLSRITYSRPGERSALLHPLPRARVQTPRLARKHNSR